MVMISGIVKTSIVLVFASLFLVGSVTAGINTILSGNAVFLGEEGLDISDALGGDTRIGWWAPGASITDRSPTKTIYVTNPMQFSISPAEFGSYTGSWYRIDPSGNANGTAFLVQDPYLDLKIKDTTIGIDVTNKWVPTGDEIQFIISTNVAQIASQRSSPALVTIKVQTPEGSEYSSLVNAAGVPVSIVDIPVPTNPYIPEAIWDTGNRALYPPGTYTIWAECNVNGMNDNYDVTGKTTSIKASLLNQEQNPLISANVPTTNPTIQMTFTPSLIPTTATPPIQTSQDTQQTTTATTTITAVPVTTTAPLPSPPVPAQTKAAGFEATLAGAAIIMGLIIALKKE